MSAATAYNGKDYNMIRGPNFVFVNSMSKAKLIDICDTLTAEWNAKTPNNGPIRVVVDSAMEGGLKIEFLSHPRWYKAIRFAAYGKWPRISATTQEDWRALHTEFIFTKGQGFSTRLKNHFGAPEWTISEIRFLKKEFADFVKVTKFHPCHMSTYKIKYRVKRMKLNYFA